MMDKKKKLFLLIQIILILATIYVVSYNKVRNEIKTEVRQNILTASISFLTQKELEIEKLRNLPELEDLRANLSNSLARPKDDKLFEESISKLNSFLLLKAKELNNKTFYDIQENINLAIQASNRKPTLKEILSLKVDRFDGKDRRSTLDYLLTYKRLEKKTLEKKAEEQKKLSEDKNSDIK